MSDIKPEIIPAGTLKEAPSGILPRLWRRLAKLSDPAYPDSHGRKIPILAMSGGELQAPPMEVLKPLAPETVHALEAQPVAEIPAKLEPLAVSPPEPPKGLSRADLKGHRAAAASLANEQLPPENMMHGHPLEAQVLSAPAPVDAAVKHPMLAARPPGRRTLHLPTLP